MSNSLSITSAFMIAVSIATTAICWGAYGPILHNGQHAMGMGRLRPFICVGIAYFVIAIVVPLLLMMFANMEAEPAKGWTITGTIWSLSAGAAGAIGALGIIMAFTFGGKSAAFYVTPIVFGCAPIINVFTSIYLGRLAGKEFTDPSPMFMAGLILVAAGASTTLVFSPKEKKSADASKPTAESKAKAEKAATAEKELESKEPKVSAEKSDSTDAKSATETAAKKE
jgi:hypothetical protein